MLLRLAANAAGVGVASSDDVREGWLAIDAILADMGGEPAGTIESSLEAWARRCHPDDQPRVRALARQLSPEGGAFAVEYRLIRPDGEIRRLLASGAAIVTTDGRVPLAILVRDLGDRSGGATADPVAELEARVHERTAQLEAANHSLSAARDRFRALFHANPLPGVIYRLADDRILDANGAFLDYFGLAADQVINRAGDGLDAVLGGTERAVAISVMLAAGTLRDVEIELPVGGELRTILLSLAPIQLSGDDCLLGVLVDITARKRAEEQVRRLASELTLAEHAERQRISSILHDDLQQRLYALQVRLASAVTRAARGDHAAAAQDTELIRRALNEALDVTRNLSVDLSPPILQGESLVHALNWLAARLKAQYGLVVDVVPATTWRPLAEGLRVALFQLVRELLFNVIKHAGVGAATVRLEQGDDWVRLTVTDTGLGFDTTQLSIGRGLEQARRRMAFYGGEFEITSQPGAGTAVTITAPMGEQQVAS